MKKIYRKRLFFWTAVLSYCFIMFLSDSSVKKVESATLISVVFLFLHMYLIWKYEENQQLKKKKMMRDGGWIIVLEVVGLVIVKILNVF